MFPEIKLNNGTIYQNNLFPFQEDFHKSEAKFRRLDGGVGCGKSVTASIEAIKESWEYPNNFGFILRKTMPQILITAYKDFLDVCPHWMVFDWNRQEKWIDVINKYGFNYMTNVGYRPSAAKLKSIDGLSRVQFISFEGTIHGFDKFASANSGWYFIEQAEQCNFEIYKLMNQRMRRVPAGRKGWFVSNTTRGRDWLWQIFSEQSTNKYPDHQEFHGRTYDNVELPEDYIKAMEWQYTEAERQVLLEGTLGDIPLAIYPELDPNIHLCQDFGIPNHWVKAIGCDHGLHNPTAMIFLAKDENGNIYAYDEYYVKNKSVAEHVAAIRHKMTNQHKCMMIDPTSGNRDGVHLDNVKNEYRRHGMFFRNSSKDVPAGVNRVKEYLQTDPERINPFTGKLGSPRLFIFQKCRTLWEELQIYRNEAQKSGIGEVNPPEKPLKYRDHTCDALRFAMMGFAIPLTKESDSKDSPHLYWDHSTEKKDNVKQGRITEDEYGVAHGSLGIKAIIEEALRPNPITTTSGATTWLSA